MTDNIEALACMDATVKLSTGLVVTIKPATFRKLKPIMEMLALIQKAFPRLDKIDNAALISFLSENYDSMGCLAASLADMEPEVIEDLPLNDFIKIVSEVISVNAAFFEREIAPLVLGITGKTGNLKKRLTGRS